MRRRRRMEGGRGGRVAREHVNVDSLCPAVVRSTLKHFTERIPSSLRSASLHQSAAKLLSAFYSPFLFTLTCFHDSRVKTPLLYLPPNSKNAGHCITCICKWKSETVKYSSCNLESNLENKEEKTRPEK